MYHVSTRLVVVVLVPLSMAACLVTDQAEERSEPAAAIVQRTCAPTDGPALSLFAPTAPQAPLYCEDFRYGQPEMGEYIRLHIFGTWDVPSDTSVEIGRTINTGFAYSKGGWGGRCRSPRECLQVDYGIVSFFEMPDARSVRFAIELEFENGDTLKFEDVARICERQVICG